MAAAAVGFDEADFGVIEEDVARNLPTCAPGVAAMWSAAPIAMRLDVLRKARYLIAERAVTFAGAIAKELQRSPADTIAAEVLPLLAAIRYLEREAATVLRRRHCGVCGRPVWMGRITSDVERVPVGRVLVIAVSNYPVLLPGVQVLQALAAGNTVIWKPGRGGAAVAAMLAATLAEAGLPDGLLVVTDESVAAGYAAIDAGVDKVFFTGSAAAGREVLQRAAEHVISCVVELSGADAVIVLPRADVTYTTRAIGFGLRLNGSATCMAPRRVLLINRAGNERTRFLEALWNEVQAIGPVRVPEAQVRLATELLAEAVALGATVLGGGTDASGRFLPALVLDGTSTMRVARTDVFAPMLTVIDVQGMAGVIAAQDACPLALTASIFGDEVEARRIAKELKVGHVTINDLIVPTADPRVPFVGRKQSGFGATRGAEGLLEMTVPRVIAVRQGASMRRYDRTGLPHLGLFAGLAALAYGGALTVRLRGAKQMVSSARVVARESKTKNLGDV